MTQEEKLLRKACERCEEYAVNHNCDIRVKCPVYRLYELACKKRERIIKQDVWSVPPSPRPEMI